MNSGKIQPVGKGFSAFDALVGQDLAEVIMESCAQKQLNIRMDAVVNDASATVLSQAYLDPATRFGLILGTGLNMAVHLPVSALGSSKFGVRPQQWTDKATHVVINTEISMFGKDILPTTLWDDSLNAAHLRPDFQPFEHVTSGRYLGEIARLVIVDGVQSAGLFNGELPTGFESPYGLDTGTLAAIEGDKTPELSNARAILEKLHPNPFGKSYSVEDLTHLRTIITAITTRATAYLAVGIHSLWSLRLHAEGISASSTPITTPATEPSTYPTEYTDALASKDLPETDPYLQKISIAANGSVIEKYPGYASRCQGYVDQMTGREGMVAIENAGESAITGAAVAVGCAWSI
jgi:hexokinase